MKIIKIGITDMDCAMCAKSIENAFVDQKGIVAANVNLSDGYARIKYDETVWTETRLAERIKLSGYTPVSFTEKKTINWFLVRVFVSVILAFPLLWTMLAHAGLPQNIVDVIVPAWLMHPLTQWALATPIQFVVGFTFYKRAYANLKSKTIGMDVLVSLATTLAYGYSTYEIIRNWDMIIAMGHYDGLLYFEASAVIIAVILVGHYLEYKVKQRTSKSLQELMELAVKEARVIENGADILKPIDMIEAGTMLRVIKGEKIPLDGVIVQGQTLVDESMITGESVPVRRTIDEPIIGATLNLGATFVMRVTQPLGTSLLQKIIEAVEEAQGQKPEIQRLADKISAIFVPTVVAIAIVSFFVNYLWLKPGQFDPSFSAAIAVMVISCPCALGLATPMSIMVGSSLSARQGILFKNGAVFEKTPTINVIAFDKTGTLTLGQPRVTDIHGDDLALLARMELASSHPLSLAIQEAAKERQLTLEHDLIVEEIVGSGLVAAEAGRTYRAGSRSFIEKHARIGHEFQDRLAKWQHEGKTVVLFATDGEVTTIVAIKDILKPSAREAIARLEKMNVQTYLISGDHDDVAQSLASEAGIPADHVRAKMTPFDKTQFIKGLQAQGLKVAFVGDGINDAIALEQADFSIAMGSGSSVAIETSDVTLLHQDLLAVVHSLTISKAVLKNIKLGFFWAFSYNLFAIPIAFLGLLSPVFAALAMVTSDVTVIANALRLKYLKLK